MRGLLDTEAGDIADGTPVGELRAHAAVMAEYRQGGTRGGWHEASERRASSDAGMRAALARIDNLDEIDATLSAELRGGPRRGNPSASALDVLAAVRQERARPRNPAAERAIAETPIGELTDAKVAELRGGAPAVARFTEIDAERERLNDRLDVITMRARARGPGGHTLHEERAEIAQIDGKMLELNQRRRGLLGLAV